jgi:putative lipoprotein
MSYHKYSKYPMCISILIALAFTAACSLQPFSSVRIKAKPTVYVPLGEKSITEAEVFTKLEETLQKNNKNIRLYRYQPSGGDDKLRYLVHYPLQTLELDISKYFNGDPLGNGGSGDNAALSQNFEKKISVPNLQQKKDVSIDVSGINQELLNRFNTGTAIPITIPPGIAPFLSHRQSVNVSFTGFNAISFENGAKLTLSSSSATVTYTITAATMESNGASVPGTISLDGKKIEFSLDGIIINNTVSFQLTLNLTSGSGNISLGTSLEGVIEKATGVTSDTDIDVNLPAQFVPLTLPADFEKATIAEGSMKLSAQMPNEWSGITIKEKMKVVQSGADGFSIDPSDYRPLGNTISLENQNLNKQQLSYTPAFKVKLNNATYTKQDSLPITLALDIKKFKEITLQNSSGFTVNREQDVPQDMKDWVKKIKFKTVSAKIKLDNGLPAENDIKIKLSSTCFQISPAQEAIFNPGKQEHEYKGNNGNAFVLDIEHLPKFDLKMQVILPNTTGTTFTLKNIETGKDITLSGSIQFNPDWEEIILKAKADQTVSFPQTGKMDLSELTSKLKTAGIQLEEIPVYFYAGSDSGLLGSTKMNVKLTATYIKTGETTDTSAVLVDKNNVALKALPVGTFPSDKIFTGTIPDAMLSIKQGESGITKTLAGIMNDYPKDLQLTCTLNMGEIVIRREDYDKPENKKPKVSIDLVVDVPVGFKVASDHTLSLMDMFGINMTGTDLFGRRSAHDKPFGLDDQILDSLRSIQVRINLKKDLSGPVTKCILRFKDGLGNPINDDFGNPIEKKITAAAGEQTVTLTSSELKKLLEKYPVSPELVLELPQGSYSLKRDFKLGASITVLAETDINYSMKVN